MESRPPEDQPPAPPRPPAPRRPPGVGSGAPTPAWLWAVLIAGFVFIAFTYKPNPFGFGPEVSYSWFLDQVDADNAKSVSFYAGGEAHGEARAPTQYQPLNAEKPQSIKQFVVYVPAESMVQPLIEKLRAETRKDKDGKVVPRQFTRIEGTAPASPAGLLFLTVVLPVLIIGAILFLMMRRARDQLDGGILGSFVKSPAKRHDKSKQRTTFEEVAGLENAKAELQEIVEFLKSPEKFQRLGGRIPKGVLLNGPPGTGKTLLARAVAGEAGVPFFSISGSEFIQMFVGVGASRVRDMFKTAKESSPCILFVDEIDAVGRVRGAGLGGGHDEREQTLNQILTEMDGFTPTETVIVLAATNRPDVLDPALLRPGRFDRHVTVDLPTRKGRLEILKVHTRHTPLAPSVDLDHIARGSVGMSGADLANLVNEAALLATREEKDAVDMLDLDAARDKIVMGAKREEVITDREKRKTAYHEIGHALVAWLTAGTDPVHKVTIIPRGRSLGVTHFLPEEDRLGYTERQVHARLDTLMGGRAAERLIYDDLTTGASMDLEQATRLARRMVTQWGMSERVGPVSFRSSDEHPFVGREMGEVRDHSEHTAQVIDEEVGRILREADDRAFRLLEENREHMEKLTNALIEREVLTLAEINDLIGPGRGVPAAEVFPDEVVASLDAPVAGVDGPI